MTKQHRRSFSPEFKLEAVRLVVEGGRPLGQVARELQLGPELLRQWKKQLQANGQVVGGPATLSAEDEVRRLRREVEVLRQERDFAKKAAAFFAKDLRGGSR
jgi:transposase